MGIQVTVDVEVGRLPGLVVAEIHRKLGPRLRALPSTLLPVVQKAVLEGMRATRHHAELLNGVLQRELGLEFPDQMVGDVEDAVVKAVRVESLAPAGEFFGGVWAGAFVDDFADALSAKSAVYVSKNTKERQTPVEWLKWLLFAGDTIVVAGRDVFGGASEYSRTGTLIMAKRHGKGWWVPPAFAGTAQSNWLTDAAHLAAPVVQREFEKAAHGLLASL